MRRLSTCLLAVISVLWLGGGQSGVVSAEAPSPPAQAIEILRGVENTRSGAKPFRIKGTFTRSLPGEQRNYSFIVESEAGKYRISKGKQKQSVAIFDGQQLFCYDGRDSAIITTPDRRATACLAFDPQSLGLSTGLYSDLTLKQNIAYHTGTDISLTRREANASKPGVVTIELTDRFSQRIRFDLQPHSPYRVYYYSKTIPLTDGDGIFTQYVTETEYWPDDADSWVPRKLVMYTLPEGKPGQRPDDVIVELEKPEFVAGFERETWTAKGLSMPFGQPLADLRIKRRVGYWNGKELVESLPVLQPE